MFFASKVSASLIEELFAKSVHIMTVYHRWIHFTRAQDDVQLMFAFLDSAAAVTILLWDMVLTLPDEVDDKKISIFKAMPVALTAWSRWRESGEQGSQPEQHYSSW